jgi:carbonic anhydrase/acetyltransferase-like protein (isoleucine patch superfamily)
VNCYLDIEIGASTLIADWTYICDFDHKTEDLDLPIKDQGLVKSPVRIGPDCWLATKVTVTRGADIGRGAVIGANSVARGNIPAYAVAAGVPAVVLADRTTRYEAGAERRKYLAGLAEANSKTAAQLHTGTPSPAVGLPVDDVEASSPSDDTSTPARSVVPEDAGGDEVEAGGEKETPEGFSSYSPVGHYGPHVRSDAHDRLSVGEEK